MMYLYMYTLRAGHLCKFLGTVTAVFATGNSDKRVHCLFCFLMGLPFVLVALHRILFSE